MQRFSSLFTYVRLIPHKNFEIGKYKLQHQILAKKMMMKKMKMMMMMILLHKILILQLLNRHAPLTSPTLFPSLIS